MSVQDAPFVPTVTAISSTPDFQWMVQPTIMTSVSPSLGGKQANEPQSSQQATPKEGGNKGKNTVKKGKTVQVGALRSCLPALAQNSRSAYASLSPAHTTGAVRRLPSLGTHFIFRSQQVCNNGLFLDALQGNMLLPFFKGCIGDGFSRSGDETESIMAVTELFLVHPSCLQRRKRKRG